MTTTTLTTAARPDSQPTSSAATAALRCVVCRRPFDFLSGQTARVLRHVAYGYDLAHDGACLAAAREWIFVEPGYDCAAFGADPQRVRVLSVVAADGWSSLTAQPARLVPLRWLVRVEYADGTVCTEGLTVDDDWRDEPGALEFPNGELLAPPYFSRMTPNVNPATR
jgi:hypothetical protein